MTRESDGRFAKGNPGGPGRPTRATEAEYLAALAEIVTLDVWRQIGTRAVSDAQAGDKAARDWLSRYLIGDRPPTGADRMDRGPVEVRIVRDPNFYGNADKVAASLEPAALAERERQLREFLKSHVLPETRNLGLRTTNVDPQS
jgi:hypothetical protein